MKRTKLILASGLVMAAAAAGAQTSSLAGTLGVYYPSNSLLQNLIGKQFLTYGATVWGGNSTNGGVAPELDAIEGSGNGNSFLIIPFTMGYEKDFTSSLTTGSRHTGVSFVPYVRAGVGIAYFDYNITGTNSFDYSTQRVGGAANIEGGLKISNDAKVFVKYNWFTVEQGFNFSGLELGVVLSLFKI